MAKELILLKDVDGLGVEGDVVNVSDGYARNCLVPQGKGTPVTNLAKKQLEKKQQVREERVAQERAGAESILAALEKISCTVPVKTGDDGKLFGSVGASDILSVLKKQGVDLDKKHLKLKDSFKKLGVFEVPLKLHPEVSTVLKVWVVEE